MATLKERSELVKAGFELDMVILDLRVKAYKDLWNSASKAWKSIGTKHKNLTIISEDLKAKLKVVSNDLTDWGQLNDRARQQLENIAVLEDKLLLNNLKKSVISSEKAKNNITKEAKKIINIYNKIITTVESKVSNLDLSISPTSEQMNKIEDLYLDAENFTKNIVDTASTLVKITGDAVIIGSKIVKQIPAIKVQTNMPLIPLLKEASTLFKIALTISAGVRLAGLDIRRKKRKVKYTSKKVINGVLRYFYN